MNILKRCSAIFCVCLITLLCVGCKRTVEDVVISSQVTETVASTDSIESVVETESEAPASSAVSSAPAAPSTPSQPAITPTPQEPIVLPAPAEPLPEGQGFDIKLSFIGDVIIANQLDNNEAGRFNQYANANPPEYFFQNVRHILEADDFTVANFENVLTDKPLSPIHKDYTPAFWFKSKASNKEILRYSGINGVTINNNHIADYGQQGITDTIEALTSVGVDYGNQSKIMYFEKEGFRVSIVCVGLWGSYSTGPALNLLEQAKANSHYQVVLYHGGTEKIHAPEEWKKTAARTFVDYGADLVVGGHPHVLQPREIYKGVEIVYSIGNFCYGGSRTPENRTVIYQMNITINRETMQLHSSQSNIIPCYVFTGPSNNYQPAIVDDTAIKQRILDFMDGRISSPV